MQKMNEMIEHSYLSGKTLSALSKKAPFSGFDVRKPNSIQELRSLGINVSFDTLLQTPVTTPSILVPVQKLQEWVPGFIRVITSARKIDEIVGISTVGTWEMEQAVMKTVETLGNPIPYGDLVNFNFSSYNVNYEYRTIVRMSDGIQVNRLEEERAARIQIDSGAMKRESCVIQLEISRNQIGFLGYNNGVDLTYGFLNDPTLPAYVTVPTGSAGFTTWASKSALEIQNDITIFAAALANQSGDNIDPFVMDLTLVLPTAVRQYLAVSTINGVSVQDWINKTYANMRVVSAPELTGANGGVNVAYLFADTVNDGSTDGGRVFNQYVPAKFLTLGVERLTNGYREQYSNATAGIFLARPYAVYRASGV